MLKQLCRTLAAPTLAAATFIVITPSDASAFVTVNVGGHNWNVDTFYGSYNSVANKPKFNTTLMPWLLGNSSLAQQFALAVKTTLGTNNIFGFPVAGPLFAYAIPAGVFGVQTSSVYNIPPNPLLPTVVNIPTSRILPYLYATATRTPVPGPLPLLGAAAAFGYSRRIRFRIRGAKTLV